MRATLREYVAASAPVAVTSVGQHAEQNLQFIRRTMERSATFTAVPRLGGGGMGGIRPAAPRPAAEPRSAEPLPPPCGPAARGSGPVRPSAPVPQPARPAP